VSPLSPSVTARSAAVISGPTFVFSVSQSSARGGPNVFVAVEIELTTTHRGGPRTPKPPLNVALVPVGSLEADAAKAVPVKASENGVQSGFYVTTGVVFAGRRRDSPIDCGSDGPWFAKTIE